MRINKQSYILSSLLIWLLLSIHMQAQIPERGYTVTFENVLLEVAIQKVMDLSGASIIYNNRLYNNEKRITAAFYNERLEMLIDALLRDTDLIAQKEGSIYVISKIKKRIYNIYGYIVSEQSGEHLAFATLYNTTLKKAYSANEKGFYSIPLSPGSYNFEVSFLGHEVAQLTVQIEADQRMDIPLDSKNILPEVIVDETPTATFQAPKNKYTHDHLMRLAARTPGIGGSNDLLQTAKLLPGIQSGAGGIGGYFVRGGSNDQNLFLLDGVAIYNPFHSLGLTSIFTPATAKSLQIYKSGFRAQYGDRSAAVIDVQLKDGNETRLFGGAGANPQDGYLTFEGPIQKGRSSFFVYGRSSTANYKFRDVLKNSLFPEEDAENTNHYYDVIGKASYKINTKSQLFFTFYKGEDRVKGEVKTREFEENDEFRSEEETTLAWGNQVFNLRLQSVLSPTLFLHASASYNKYFSEFKLLSEERFEERDLDEFFYTSISSFNEDIEVRSEIDAQLNSLWRIKTGVGFLRKTFVPDFDVFDEDSDEFKELDDVAISNFDAVANATRLYAHKAVHYLENSINLNRIKFQLGLRSTYYLFEDSDYFHQQPRGNLDISIAKSGILSLSASKMVQYVHLLSSSEVNLPRDLWHPAFDDLPPEESWHYNVGYTQRFGANFSVGVETYIKETENKTISSQIPYVASTPVASLFTNVGSARASGVEVMTEMRMGGWETLISYANNKTTLSSPMINEGLQYPFQFDRQHELKSVHTFQINKHLVLGLSSYLGSGHPYLVTSEFDLNVGINPIDINRPGQKNQTRTDWQHRVDLSLLYTRQLGPTLHRLKVNVYNIYRQEQPLFYTIDAESPGQDLIPNFSMPLIPSIAYSIHF